MKRSEINQLDWIKYNMYFGLQHFFGLNNFERFFGKSKTNFDKKIEQKLENLPRPGKIAVPIVDKDISFEEFKKNSHQPLVFKGAACDWDSNKKWSFDFFKDNYGSSEVLLNNNKGLIDEDNPQEFTSLKLEDYIDSMKSGSLSYLKFARDIINDNRELKEDLNLKWLRAKHFPFSFREEVVLFMSGANTLTPTHAGVSCNLFIQVKGKKTWTLWEPEERIFLNGLSDRTFYYYAKPNPNKINDPKFPLFKYAKTYEVTLDAGDVLWVPPFTWHHVYNPTPSIGISYRFMNVPAAFKGSKLLMSLIFFATKPNPFYHFYMSTFKNKTAIFQKEAK